MYRELVEKYSSFNLSPSQRLDDLRQISSQDLLDYLHSRGFRIDDYGLTLENSDCLNSIWTRPPIHLIRRGFWNPFLDSILLGTNQDEGTMLAYAFQTSNHHLFQDFLKIRSPSLSTSIIEHLYEDQSQDLGSDDPPQVEAHFIHPSSPKPHPSVHFLAHNLFEAPLEHFLSIISKTKHAKTGQKCRLYVYRLESTIKDIDEATGWGSW